MLDDAHAQNKTGPLLVARSSSLAQAAVERAAAFARVEHIVPLGAFALEAQQVAIGEADVDAPPTARDGAGSSGSLDISETQSRCVVLRFALE